MMVPQLSVYVERQEAEEKHITLYRRVSTLCFYEYTGSSLYPAVRDRNARTVSIA